MSGTQATVGRADTTGAAGLLTRISPSQHSIHLQPAWGHRGQGHRQHGGDTGPACTLHAARSSAAPAAIRSAPSVLGVTGRRWRPGAPPRASTPQAGVSARAPTGR